MATFFIDEQVEKKTYQLALIPSLFVFAIGLAVLAGVFSHKATQAAWQHPAVSVENGFLLITPVVGITPLGITALIALGAAIIFAIRFIYIYPSSLSASLFMLSVGITVLICITPQIVATHTIISKSSQSAFNSWSAARYGVDTSALSVEDHTLLMRTPDPKANLRAVQLADGTLIQAISDSSGARYLIATLGSELPVIAGK